MPIVYPPSVGAPGDAIDSAKLDVAFDAFSAATPLDGSNLRPDTLTAYHLVQSAINGIPTAAKNTSSTTTAYTGTSYQAITHGTNLEVGPVSLPDTYTIRVHWHQYMTAITLGAPDTDEFVTFKLQWNIGAGYVDVPDLLLWGVSGYTSNSTGDISQVNVHNPSGSWCYQNTSGSTISITGIRLMVRPAQSDVAGSVNLGEGTLIQLVVKV